MIGFGRVGVMAQSSCWTETECSLFCELTAMPKRFTMFARQE